MAKEKHPLMNNPRWVFNQPEVGFKAHYLAIDMDTQEEKIRSMQTSCTCREGIISNARQGFQNGLLNRKRDWSEKHIPKVIREANLQKATGKRKPTELKIQDHSNFRARYHKSDFSIEEFIKVCNIVMGPICVLLGPNRLDGDQWWKTDPKKAVIGKDWIHWKGSDNWFLAHPATMAIATGLYRQCYHLCGTGLGEKIIDTLNEQEVEEVMSSNSQKLALQLIKQTREYIEVPAGTNGSQYNYPFYTGYWRRLQRLQRAIRRHGYEKSLGQSFAEGWALLEGNLTTWSGLYGFWGDNMEGFTKNHNHLMEMGKPRRRQSADK